MQTNGIDLGDKAKDAITGFAGVVTGICHYLTGCSQASIQPLVDEKGGFTEARWFDVDRLQVVEKNAVQHVVRTDRGGPAGSAPIK